MKICFVSHEAELVGAERSMMGIVDYLRQQGEDVYMILPDKGPFSLEIEKRGIPFKIIPYKWWTYPAYNPITAGMMLKGMIRASEKIAKCAQEWKADIIYTNTSVICVGALASVRTGKPHVWHLREIPSIPRWIHYFFPVNIMMNFMHMTSNVVIYNSNTTRRAWEGDALSKRSHVIYNYFPREIGREVDAREKRADEIFRAKNGFKVAMVGAIAEWKGQLEAVQAIDRLVQAGRDICLFVAGPVLKKRYFKRMQNFIKKNNLQANIRYLGCLHDPTGLTREVDISLTCSTLESFGRVIVESMVCGTPVVGARGGGTNELIVDMKNGCLYDPGNVDQLADKIAMLMDDKALLSRMSEKARETSTRFQDPDFTVKKIHDMLLGLRHEKNPAQDIQSALDILRTKR